MAATVRTMFSTRQDVHTKFNRPDGNLHTSDDQASYMKIACTSSTVRPSPFMVRTLQSLFMIIPCSRSATVWTWPCYGSFQCYFGKAVAVDRPDSWSSRPDTLRYLGDNVLLKYRIGTKSLLLESWQKKLPTDDLDGLKKSSDGPPSGRKYLIVQTALQKIPEYFSDK